MAARSHSDRLWGPKVAVPVYKIHDIVPRGKICFLLACKTSNRAWNSPEGTFPEFLFPKIGFHPWPAKPATELGNTPKSDLLSNYVSRKSVLLSGPPPSNMAWAQGDPFLAILGPLGALWGPTGPHETMGPEGTPWSPMALHGAP